MDRISIPPAPMETQHPGGHVSLLVRHDVMMMTEVKDARYLVLFRLSLFKQRSNIVHLAPSL